MKMKLNELRAIHLRSFACFASLSLAHTYDANALNANASEKVSAGAVQT